MKVSTKEKIMDEALTLFSINGFKGTSVKSIAHAVGIRDSSIYKHFRSKREIFNAIVAQIGKRMESLADTLGLPSEENGEGICAFYGDLSLEKLQELSRKCFLFYLQDPFVSRFWRMAQLEQYQNQEIYQVFRKIFMEDSIAYQKAIFAEMVEKKLFQPVDPEVLAISFYAPIYFLLSKYAGRPAQAQEALKILDKQVAEFYRNYNTQQST